MKEISLCDSASGDADLRRVPRRPAWTLHEEQSLAYLHSIFGNSWQAISERLPGRTAGDIKNVWHSTLRLKFPGNRSFLLAYARAVQALGEGSTRAARQEVYRQVVKKFGMPDMTEGDALPPPHPSHPYGANFMGTQLQHMIAAVAAQQHTLYDGGMQLMPSSRLPYQPEEHSDDSAKLHVLTKSPRQVAQLRKAPCPEPMHTGTASDDSSGLHLGYNAAGASSDHDQGSGHMAVGCGDGSSGGVAVPAAPSGADQAHLRAVNAERASGNSGGALPVVWQRKPPAPGPSVVLLSGGGTGAAAADTLQDRAGSAPYGTAPPRSPGAEQSLQGQGLWGLLSNSRAAATLKRMGESDSQRDRVVRRRALNDAESLPRDAGREAEQHVLPQGREAMLRAGSTAGPSGRPASPQQLRRGDNDTAQDEGRQLQQHVQQRLALALHEAWERDNVAREAARPGNDRPAPLSFVRPNPSSPPLELGQGRLAEAREDWGSRPPPQAAAGCEGAVRGQARDLPPSRDIYHEEERRSPQGPMHGAPNARLVRHAGKDHDAELRAADGQEQAPVMSLRRQVRPRSPRNEKPALADEDRWDNDGAVREAKRADATDEADAVSARRSGAGGSAVPFDPAALFGALTAAGCAPVVLEVASGAEEGEGSEPVSYLAVALPKGFGRLVQAACGL